MALKHRDFDKIKRWVSARDCNGFPIPVWGWGPPGGGKTHLGAQIAEELKVDFLPMAFGPTTTDTRVVGYLSASNGSYIPGIAYGWFKNGGLYFMDEIDNCEPSALVSINALLANDRFRFPNGELVAKHKDTYALAGANTLGTGAQNGFRRQSQDAAARSRWAKVRLEYDEELERALATPANALWVTYVQKVRVAVNRLAKTNVWITPRDSIIGAAALRNGVPPEEVVEHLMCELSEDARRQVLAEVGVFDPNPPPPPKPRPAPQYDTAQTTNPGGGDLSELQVPGWWTKGGVGKKPSKKFRDYE